MSTFKIGDKVKIKDSQIDQDLEGNNVEKGVIYTVVKITFEEDYEEALLTLDHHPNGGVFAFRFEKVEPDSLSGPTEEELPMKIYPDEINTFSIPLRDLLLRLGGVDGLTILGVIELLDDNGVNVE